MNEHNRVTDHPAIGTVHTYRPDLPIPPGPFDGRTVVAPGMDVHIVSAFNNWNDVPGLSMFYVYVPDTGYHTHVTPADLWPVTSDQN